ncbi:sulfite exporter TauE/SafE family protein [Flavobacterium silvisoli]|uniref:Probable membrane transporter protein n=1 Tax=Flavobacterium silvisoli TaxID=2529433 RepID=A0A4Q9YV13_9FLAO|nr:sulfite exporter TauE/SafE family protein [Flavobacterium silvisoli]TBX67547.1 sulfite exporter TauE/SafE family protein [Flavobacterium silvisoli]
MDYLIYFILLALLAEILGTVGGFGSSLFFIPIAGYFLDFHSVLGVTALFHVLSNTTKIAFFHKGFDKKLIVSLGIPAVVFVIIGAYLSQFIATQWLEMSLAVFLIALSSLFLIFKNIVIKPTHLNSVGGGIASGFVAGILGTGGAIRGITLAAFNLKMEIFIATSAIIDLAIDSSRAVVYGFNGYIHKDDLYLIPILLVVSIFGTYIGKKILTKISEEQFKKTVLVLILITGITTAARVIHAL